MKTWTRDELETFGAAEEIEVAPFGRDGKVRRAVTIWIVRVGDDLYVRSAYGRRSAWFRAAQTRHQGRISSKGIERDVIFLDAETNLNEDIDAAYRGKYRRSGAQYVNMMVGEKARSATVKLAAGGPD
jgi:hypothetical protein